METAGVIAAVLMGAITLFQLALAAGAPLGAAAWGGQHPGVLPGGLRIASGVNGLVLYPALGAVILASSGAITAGWIPWTGPTTMWVLAGFFGVGAIANTASRSRIERVWAPVALAIAICCAIVAASA